MSNVKSITRKLSDIVKQMSTLQDDELEKILINRSMLDRLYLMRRSRKTKIQLLENRMTFKDFILNQK